MEMSTYQSVKLWLVHATGLAKDALHVHVGLAVFFAVVVLARRPLASPLPWLAAAAAAISGELLDLTDDLRGLGHWRWDASVHDIINTMIWPTVIVFLARVARLPTA